MNKCYWLQLVEHPPTTASTNFQAGQLLGILFDALMHVVDTLPRADVREFAQVVTKRRGGKLGHLQETQ